MRAETLKFIWKLATILATINSSSSLGNASAQSDRQLRVELNSTLPVDPLYLSTMAQYDLSLILYRSWFDYDNGRRADHGLIKTWKFEESSGRYSFQIENRKWSDGSPLVAEQFVTNLKRLIESGTPYGKSLGAIVDWASVKIEGVNRFSFCTRNKQASENLFNQLGSVFLSLIYPGDLNKKGHVLTNSRAIGPYRVERNAKSEVIFTENSFYPQTNSRAPREIIVRPLAKDFSIEKFLERKTWANYYQTNTMIPIQTAKKLMDSHFPIWSRGFDRVALLKPIGSEKQITDGRKLLSFLGARLNEAPRFTHPLQVASARSLQPIGYPLFKELEYPDASKPEREKTLRILSSRVPSLVLYQEMLAPRLSQLGYKIQWHIVEPDEFMKMDWNQSGSDLVLFSFGVADPEPSTWLGLVFGRNFIAYDKSERLAFEKLLKVEDHGKQLAGYVALLNSIGIQGGYLPLLHGATVSIGHPGMNFDLVHKLDETVDYSKIQFGN